MKKMNYEITDMLLKNKINSKDDLIEIIKKYNIISSNEIINILEKGNQNV
jgi:hypothetical protein